MGFREKIISVAIVKVDYKSKSPQFVNSFAFTFEIKQQIT